MIEINLLPEERRKQKEHLKTIDLKNLDLENLPFAKIGIAVFGSIAIIHILLFAISVYCRANISSLDSRYKALLPQKKEADALKLQKKDIETKIRIIDGLTVNRFSWAKKLNDLSDSMTPDIWLVTLHYDEKTASGVALQRLREPRSRPDNIPPKPITESTVSRYLVLSGYALNPGSEGTAAIGKFIKTLKENKDFYSDFSNIELGAIRRAKLDDQEVMDFTVTCFFK